MRKGTSTYLPEKFQMFGKNRPFSIILPCTNPLQLPYTVLKTPNPVTRTRPRLPEENVPETNHDDEEDDACPYHCLAVKLHCLPHSDNASISILSYKGIASGRFCFWSLCHFQPGKIS